MGNKFCSVVVTVLLIASTGALFLRYAGASETKYENYWAETYDHATVDIHFMAQIFTTASQHNVSAIVLWFNRVGLPGLFNVSIRATTAYGVPTNVNLADCNNTDGDSFSNVFGSPTKVVFSLTPEITLNASTLYAIVVSYPSNGDESHQLRWATGWDTYDGGNLLFGTANGRDWDAGQEFIGEDAYFEIWDADPTAVISSLTHPNQEFWYSNNAPVFQWETLSVLSGIAGYSYVLDNSPTALPDENIETTGNSISFNDLADGTWYFHIRAKDNLNNWCSASHYQINIDTQLPSGSVLISQDATYTASAFVTLTLTYNDATSGVSLVRYSNENSTWSDWGSPSATKAWTLTSGDGTKTVHYQIEDNAGLVATYYDQIFLDTTPPVANAGQNQTVDVGVTVNFSASSSTDNMGVVSYSWDFGDGASGTGTATIHAYSNPGKYTVALTVEDVAGNRDTSSITVTVQYVIPEFPTTARLIAVMTTAFALILIIKKKAMHAFLL